MGVIVDLLRAFFGYAFMGILANGLLPEPIVLIFFTASAVSGGLLCYKVHESIRNRIRKPEYW